MENRLSPAFVSGKDKTSWNKVMLKSYFNSVLLLLLSVPVRNKKSAQADRLSAITMALQYESDEEGILSGTYSPHRQ